LALFPFAVTESLGWIGVLDGPVFVLTLAVPVLRYRLWAIERIVRRSAVYALVPDPYHLLSGWARRLDAVPAGEALDALVRAVGTSLRLPYVAVEDARGGVLASSGEPGPACERWDSVYEGTVHGHLVASPRPGEDALGAADRELLADVAHQVGVAVYAQGVTADLLTSRQRLVTAREEERRRLRRELHDGLGPVLTAVGLSLDAARARLSGPDPADAERHIKEAKEAASQALADLRELVHGLRPPALDELGLVAAVRTQAERLAADGALRIELVAEPAPEFPAAVEVAAYRVAVEALTNVVRHGGARSCTIRFSAPQTGVLQVEVADDGPGREPWRAGVGLTAMRERVEELGGSLAFGPQPAGGARVVARLPFGGTP
jgi:signal transduction histidine kinase